MEAKVTEWTISHLYKMRESIHEQPKYQRGKVWKELKSQLLVDSILRGIDLPKIYLRKINNGLYSYEVADGQQRINAILKFMKDELPLSSQNYKGLDLSKIGSFSVGGKKKSEINSKLQEKFENHKLTIAIIEDATNNDIRTLFGRLQMGDPLNPAEIRNAIISNLGDHIDLFVKEHDFFTSSKIKPDRYKRQDFLVHCFALLHYRYKYDLKAPLFQKLYYELSSKTPDAYIDIVSRTLTHMYEIDKVAKKRITNKWSFVDIFNVISANINRIVSIDYKSFAKAFYEFEKIRIKTKKPERLIQGKTPSKEEKELYDYIMAFKANGGNPSNLEIRAKIFSKIFTAHIKYN